MRKTTGAILLALAASACAIRPPTLPPLTQTAIQEKTGHPARPPEARPDGALPAGVVVADGVTEDEAAATALWNNAQLAADLAGLGVARAGLIDAGQFRNPTLQTLFPIGLKPFELTLALPLEQFWQRPRRVAAAQAQWDELARSLVQNGLNTARDARRAHAALAQAQERLAATREASAVKTRVAAMAKARFDAGDISVTEVKMATADADAAADLAQRSEHDLVMARDRLRVTMGLPPGTDTVAVPGPLDRRPPPPVDVLRELAWAERSDLRAAELAIASAASRAKWERSRLVALGAILSVKEVGANGVLTGPGVSIDLPVFRSTAGPVSRADAEVEQAARRYVALRQQVDLEVATARQQLVQALESLSMWHEQIAPALKDAAARTRRAYEAGDVSYMAVLEATRQSIDAQLRDIDTQAAARAAAAELDRCVGTRVEREKEKQP